MECPRCGYAMAALDPECPRCANLPAGEQGRAPVAPAAMSPTVTAPPQSHPLVIEVEPEEDSGMGQPPPLVVEDCRTSPLGPHGTPVLDISAKDLSYPTPPRTATSPAPTQPTVIPQNPPARDAWYLSASGQVFGPYHTTTLRQWLRDGQIAWDSLVSRGEAEPWRPARQVVEFIDPKPPYGGIPTPAGTPGPGVGPFGPAQPGLILPTTPPKSPAIAVLLNILLLGIGYVYLGQVAKGLVVLFVGMIVGGGFLLITFGLGLPVWLIVFVVTSIDAYQLAKKLERGQPIREWETFPR